MSIFAIVVAAMFLPPLQAASVEGTVVQIGTTQPVSGTLVQIIRDASELLYMETGASLRTFPAGSTG